MVCEYRSKQTLKSKGDGVTISVIRVYDVYGFLYELKIATWRIPPLTLLFREMRSADSRMASLLEISSDLSISSPLVNKSLRAMYAAVSLTLASSVPEYPVANSSLGVCRSSAGGWM